MSSSETFEAALSPFQADGLIDDVLRVLKSGKEGTVYCCRAGPAIDQPLLAAKVYRPSEHRTFKNDAQYHEGRGLGVSDGPGGTFKGTGRPDRRMQRAFAKKTKIGRSGQYTSWIHHEFLTLQRLHAAGAAVPRPYAQCDNAILMTYVGDEEMPAPLLQHVGLPGGEADALFRGLLAQIELWLRCDRIHADLSPFNILYWQSALTVIDFPQAVDPWANPNAFNFLQRDLENVCRYFARYGIDADAAALATSFWRRCVLGDGRGDR